MSVSSKRAVRVIAKVRMPNGKYSTEQFSVIHCGSNNEQIRVWEKLSNSYIAAEPLLSKKQLRRVAGMAMQKIVNSHNRKLELQRLQQTYNLGPHKLRKQLAERYKGLLILFQSIGINSAVQYYSDLIDLIEFDHAGLSFHK